MSVSIDIEKRLGDFQLKVRLEGENEVLALLGASGCGKSMTLKCIAGIEKPDRGRIVVDGETLFDSKKHINLSPQQRRTGLMFQNYALFPNMTVRQNIRAGALREKEDRERERRIDEIMERFGLTELEKHYPAQLSGGQQQRTALARILVSGPRILLLDEPFSALDSHLRFKLEREVMQVIRRFGKTVILVSHDRDEVFRLSDKIAVMNAGKVETFGPKAEVFANPKTRTAAILTGCKNISAIKPIGERRVFAEDWGIELETGENADGFSYIGIRMHDVEQGTGENSFVCSVVEEIENPFSYTIMLRPEGADEDSTPIGWETQKEDWAKIRSEKVAVRLPKGAQVLLK